MYRLDFTRDSAGVEPTQPDKKYGICIQSILTAQKPASFDTWDDVIGLVKKLKSIGKEKLSGTLKLYDLNEGGGVLELERAERVLLLDFIRSCAWQPEFLEDVRNTYKWIEGLQEVDSQAGPKLEDKRRAKI